MSRQDFHGYSVYNEWANERIMDRNPTLESLMLGLSQLGVNLKKTQPTKLLILSTVVYGVYAMDPFGLAIGWSRSCRIFDYTV